ncbi:hypothetical protein C2W63_02308 [Bacillus velezensis]|nr:hypothetical protein C2W63_02308 [Bacillus velezensis]RUR97916.1 hypothetical protein EFW57_02290 [Bacillus velezensis]
MITSAVFMCFTSRFHNSIILTNKSIKNSPDVRAVFLFL